MHRCQYSCLDLSTVEPPFRDTHGTPEWRLGWGLLIINQQINFFFYSALESFALLISSNYIMYKNHD